MRRIRIGLLLAALSAALLWLSVGQSRGSEIAERGRMKNVEVGELALPASESARSVTAPPSVSPTPAPTPEPEAAPPEEAEEPPPEPTPLPDGSIVRPTSIRGGLSVRNETAYELDVASILEAGPPLRLPAEGPQILIIHTHASEAYTPAGIDRYEASDSCRTEDERYNVIRIGDELAAVYEAAGLSVIHDRGVYDYPSYTGSYGRTAAAIEGYLAEYPELAAVIDVHRDALGSDGVVYKIMADESGVVASQLMLLCGSDESGLEHPHWRDNLAFALYLQQAVDSRYPTLLRPVALVPQRYNQQLTRGSLILEVGSSGNTLQEALAAVRLFGEATAGALLALAED
ncbi:MAG: stage II sporulation protein P [Oscillospiraceae bacterium]|nr:stage II sporulation protein P [Oscillospiraceae bacterium]